MYRELKQRVYEANMQLVAHGLVIFTWGNVSAFDESSGAVAIKPSGVDYGALTPDDIVVLDLESNVLEGSLRPSSDTPTHLELYRQFGGVGAVVHTHSRFATTFAQAKRDIPALGTTHADYFHGDVPCTPAMRAESISKDYELNTGRHIAETFRARGIDPLAVPAALVASHGPFVWGKDAAEAVHNAVVFEYVAEMAYRTILLGESGPMQKELLDGHYLRKHGENAYYGQG